MSMSLMHALHLPPEIIALVFQLSIDPNCSVPCTWDQAQSIQPLLFSRVCRRWYSLVTQDPSLWSHIHVEPSSRGLARARLWLERSQNVPLHISICARNMRDDSWEPTLSLFVPTLVDMFIPHLSRIRGFQSHLGGHVVPALFPPDTLVSMPLIEQLGLRIDDASSHSLVTAFLESSLGRIDAPHLRSLAVSDITTIAEAIAPVLPQLRSLNVLDAKLWAHARIFPALLARCKKIEHCSIAFPPNCYFVSPVEPIDLPDLKTLEMEWPFLFDAKPLFRAITAPHLESLTLSHLTRQLILPPTTFYALRSLIQSATSTLRSITLVGCNLLTQDESTALFEDCVSLEQLTLTHCQHVDKLLSPLTPGTSAPSVSTIESDEDSPLPASSNTWLCPRLLEVTIDGIEDAGVRSIVAFARSRCIWPSSSSSRIPSPMLSSFLERSPHPAEVNGSQSPDAVSFSHIAKQQRRSQPRPIYDDVMPLSSGTSSKDSFGHSYLKQLTLDVDITALSRQARVLLLSGLYPMHHDMHIMGSCGELFARADADAHGLESSFCA
ncbi:hypothetical protein D9619_005468 [Psilocybe cf. subviscida]|uniref:F-box domain-containing protein n=1 Tax=Psilocybe cf. subviscida TaxID=2480587 RepID=A0A8H5BW91_9AGAR|nr:hypothetical protein D9619_005468 [Psilocybe cf. subviscida]